MEKRCERFWSIRPGGVDGVRIFGTDAFHLFRQAAGEEDGDVASRFAGAKCEGNLADVRNSAEVLLSVSRSVGRASR